MKHKLVVFDWNGTILSDTIPAWKAANDCLDFYERPRISLKRYRDTSDFPVLKFYEANGCAAEYVMSRKDESNPLFQNAYETYAKNARTRTGARDVLDWIKTRGLGCIILSNYLTERIEHHVNRLKLENYFDYISAHNCDGTTILQSTTKVGRLEKYMTQHGYKPEDTVIIGDSLEEPEIARDLGLVSVSITDGYVSRKRLKQAAPDHIIDTLSELKDVLKARWEL